MTAIAVPVRRPAGWTVVAGRELRDLWAGGRALTLSTVYSLFLSVVVYLLASGPTELPGTARVGDADRAAGDRRRRAWP